MEMPPPFRDKKLSRLLYAVKEGYVTWRELKTLPPEKRKFFREATGKKQGRLVEI